MNAKEYLSQVLRTDKDINKMIERLSDLKLIASKVTTSYGSEIIKHNRETNPLEKIMVKIIDLESEIDERINSLVDYKIEVVNLLNKVSDDRERSILRMRYINYKSWNDIAYELGISTRWVLKTHGTALENFYKILKSSPIVHM